MNNDTIPYALYFTWYIFFKTKKKNENDKIQNSIYAIA